MRNRTLKLKYNQKAAAKILDVVKTRELQSDIGKIFYVEDFGELTEFLDDDWHYMWAENFGRQYCRRTHFAYDSELMYDDLHNLALNTLSRLHDEYVERHESLDRDRDGLAFYEIIECENELVDSLNGAFEDSALYLAYVVEGYLHPPADRIIPQAPGTNI